MSAPLSILSGHFRLPQHQGRARDLLTTRFPWTKPELAILRSLVVKPVASESELNSLADMQRKFWERSR